MIKSVTAIKKGFGSDKYRHVTNLTGEEREAVKAGEIVWFRIDKTSWKQSGYKIVTHSAYGYDSREPDAAELAEIEKSARTGSLGFVARRVSP